MGFDDLHRKRQGNLRKRKSEIKELEPLRFLIVCEGEKTEPNYLEALRKKLNDKYRKNFVTLRIECVDIIGRGRNTESLVEYTKKIRDNAIIGYGNIWCVFDKDSFSAEQFNGAITKAKNENISVAWSNEAIELWFLLHFEYINSGITRDQYITKLNAHFKNYGINNGKYGKNLTNIYEILENYGNYPKAVKFAKRLEELHKGQTPANSKPMTKVYELIEELKKLLEK